MFPTPQAPSAPHAGAEGQSTFLNRGAKADPVSPDRLLSPPSPYILQAGTVIPAALITGLRSDMPGQIAAQVTSNVYDSPSGRYRLIPQGARLLGEYDSNIVAGQNRLLLVWTRLILSDGRSISLNRKPRTDGTGAAGEDDVAIREAAQGTIGRTGEEIVRQQIAVPPTLTIRPGFPVRVIITRDMILEPLGEVR